MTDMQDNAFEKEVNQLILLEQKKLQIPNEEIIRFEQVLKEGEAFRKLLTFYRCAMLEVETKFRVLNEEFSLQHDRNPIETIKTRLKNPASICEKMFRKGIPLRVSSVEENIFDIAGIRVVCSFEDDIYLLAKCLLQQDDIRLVTMKDYIKNPKANGYRSLHLIVETPIFLSGGRKLMKVEIQLRTIAMDFWASLEHQLQYKKEMLGNTAPLTAELAQCAEQCSVLDKKMLEIRKDLDAQRQQGAKYE